jgi:hypothetical protein
MGDGPRRAHPPTCTCHVPDPQSHSPTIRACVRRLHASHAGRREYSVSVVSSCRGTWGGRLRLMQVQAHSITARRPPLVCVGTGGGNPSPRRARRPPVAVPPPSGAWGGCSFSGQRTPASDPGAAARGEAEPTRRSAAPQLANAATRNLQPPPRPPPALRSSLPRPALGEVAGILGRGRQQEIPARPRAAKPSRRDDQRPRS